MLLKATIDALDQVTVLLDILSDQPPDEIGPLFTGERIGSHLRHVHDHFRAFLIGCESGTLDYNHRNRNCPAETDLRYCRREHEAILAALPGAAGCRGALKLISEIDCQVSRNVELASTVERELLYLINHTIHHVAIVSLILARHGIAVPQHLGLAPGTASFQRETGQPAKACAR